MIPFREKRQFISAESKTLDVRGVCLPSDLSPGCLAFTNSFESYPIKFKDTYKASAVSSITKILTTYIFISDRDFSENPSVKEDLKEKCIELIPVTNPRDHFIFAINSNSYAIDFKSLLGKNPSIHSSAHIHPSAFISENVYIDSGVTVGPGCVIGEGTYIGKNTIIQSNCTIGCDGINAYNSSITNKLTMMPHFSGVFIGENVYIGSGSTINRGVFNMTMISNHCILGSNVLIGHNASLDNKVWLSSGVLVGGGSHLSECTKIGLGAIIRDNLSIGSNVNVGMGSVVYKNVLANRSLIGNPARITPKLSAGPDF
ncbi:UDP-3-O-[3-hydroxymyristoyl] glucosamine N-acyltransferase [Synechococcus sp. RCC307]|nr:UDP-3-O-[3-hydroxymyristoyl] glucosamine N-acyltransferase [Synechococcus sp. RCC307]